MSSLLFRWLVNTLALLIVGFLPGFFIRSFGALLLAALVLGLLNALVKPILVLLTLPLTVVTLGLFLIVLNAIVLKLTAWVVPGYEIDGFLPAVLGAIIVSIVSALSNRYGKGRPGDDRADYR